MDGMTGRQIHSWTADFLRNSQRKDIALHSTKLLSLNSVKVPSSLEFCQESELVFVVRFPPCA